MQFAEEQKSLWRLAGPIMISNITVALLGMVDTAVVGHLDQPYYLGGVTLAMVIFNFLYWGFAFLRMGTTGIIAQFYGANDSDNLRASLSQALILASILGFIVLLFQSPVAAFSFSLLQGSEDVKIYANIYYNWAIWAAPAVLLNLVMTGYLLGMQRATSSLLLAVTINLLNIFFDLIFVLVLDMDVRGVALATVIAQYSGLLLAIYLSMRLLKQHPGHWRKDLVLHFENIKDMLAVNHNIFLRTVSLIFVFAFFTHQGAGMSDNILAANAVLMNFYLLMALGLDGFATASEALVGKSVGARDNHAFWQSVKIAMAWAFVFSIFFSFLFLIFGKDIINMITNLEEVRVLAYEHLVWLIIAPLLAIWCFTWDGIYIGARRAVEMRNSMLFSTFVIFVPVWYFSQFLGNHGLWLALSMFLIARSISMTYLAWRIEKKNGFVTRMAV